MNQTKVICDAIAEMRKICFFYSDKLRYIEPHQLGITPNQKLQLSGFDYKELKWKQFLVSDITSLEPTNEYFSLPRSGYNPGPNEKYPVIVQEIKLPFREV